MRCADCKWKYPDSFLNQMFIGGQGYTEPICGICALERTNRLHGIPRASFQGEIAEATRQAAITWRRNHPIDGPNQQKGTQKK